MSAFIVDKVHIDLMVSLGLRGPRGLDVRPWHELHWFTVPDEQVDAHPYVRLDEIVRRLRYETADEVGQMLVCENVLSVRHRYPDVDEGGKAPGPVEEYWREPYAYREPGYRPTAVEGLCIVACFEYQSCEHPDWFASEARSFCSRLRGALINRLPGYEDAPWGWDAKTVARRRAEHLTGVTPMLAEGD